MTTNILKIYEKFYEHERAQKKWLAESYYTKFIIRTFNRKGILVDRGSSLEKIKVLPQSYRKLKLIKAYSLNLFMFKFVNNNLNIFYLPKQTKPVCFEIYRYFDFKKSELFDFFTIVSAKRRNYVVYSSRGLVGTINRKSFRNSGKKHLLFFNSKKLRITWFFGKIKQLKLNPPIKKLPISKIKKYNRSKTRICLRTRFSLLSEKIE
jgi:hypothetical protein